MRNCKAGLNVCLVLLISMFAHISCTSEEQDTGIHEIDKKYLSESQLFALHQAIENDPDNSENYYRRAKVYFDRKDQRKALQDILQAVKLKNTNGQYYLLQAKILKASGEISSAIEAAKTAESLKVNDAEIKILLAGLYLEMDQKGKAHQYLSQAVQLTPYHPDIYFLKGKTAAINGDTSSAVSNFFTAIKRDTVNIEAYKELSKIYFANQKYDSAMMFVSIGRSIEPEDPFFYYIEGRFLGQLNMKESSKASYLTSLKVDSTYSDAYQALAMVNYREGNLNVAAVYFEKELKYNPGSVNSIITLSEIYEKQNRGNLAIPQLEKLLAKDPGNTKAKIILDRLYVVYPKRTDPRETQEETIVNVPDSPVEPAPKPADKVEIKKKVPVKVDTVKKVPADKGKMDSNKPDTANKKAPLPVKVDTLGNKTSSKQDKGKRDSGSNKENRFFKRNNRNSDTAKSETR